MEEACVLHKRCLPTSTDSIYLAKKTEDRLFACNFAEETIITMMFTSLGTVTITIFLVMLTCISAAPQFGLQGVPRVYSNEPPSPYDYQYKVEHSPTNTFYGKSESGDVTGKVTGSYYVYLPDGRLMTVDYLVDGESGFVPKVTFATQAYPGVRV